MRAEPGLEHCRAGMRNRRANARPVRHNLMTPNRVASFSVTMLPRLQPFDNHRRQIVLLFGSVRECCNALVELRDDLRGTRVP